MKDQMNDLILDITKACEQGLWPSPTVHFLSPLGGEGSTLNPNPVLTITPRRQKIVNPTWDMIANPNPNPRGQ